MTDDVHAADTGTEATDREGQSRNAPIADETTSTDPVGNETAAAADIGGMDGGSASDRAEAGTDHLAPDLGELSLPQRVFVAAVQNPARGVLILFLFAFAFSFYIAFWMVYPRVAGFVSMVGIVVGAVVVVTYYVIGRLRG